nr:MAG TPA: hypothetical protein [Caudoviricetes sp.]
MSKKTYPCTFWQQDELKTKKNHISWTYEY